MQETTGKSYARFAVAKGSSQSVDFELGYNSPVKLEATAAAVLTTSGLQPDRLSQDAGALTFPAQKITVDSGLMQPLIVPPSAPVLGRDSPVGSNNDGPCSRGFPFGVAAIGIDPGRVEKCLIGPVLFQL